MNSMEILSVDRLHKSYGGFVLKNVSFALEAGKITGFIGRNGAGKTTTLKSILNFVHPDSGETRFFGMPFRGNELAIKQKIGFVSGGVNYYPQKKLKTITSVYKRFYPDWDEAAYRRYLSLFKLNEEKTPAVLSAGMKVKYSLALALSHHASLLMLDEPTSGLDPVSRDELLDVFLKLVAEEGITILFSTHITSDLERCADNIIYIRNGEIIADQGIDAFIAGFKVVHVSSQPDKKLADKLIGVKKDRTGYAGLIRTSDLPITNAEITDADLETIMIHMERSEQI